jgi:hypothetical protein
MKNYPEISELNKNSKFKYKLGEGNSNILQDNNETFEKINNYMSFDFYIPSLKERKQIIRFYGFPTDEDDRCLASYYSTSVNENVFGIEIGADISKAEEILLSYGYSKNENSFVKGKVKIKFNCNSNTIASFEISLDSKYLGNRLY